MNAAPVRNYPARLRKLHGQCAWHQAKVVAAEDLWTLLVRLAENDPYTALKFILRKKQFSTLANHWMPSVILHEKTMNRWILGYLFWTNPLRCSSQFITMCIYIYVCVWDNHGNGPVKHKMPTVGRVTVHGYSTWLMTHPRRDEMATPKCDPQQKW